ncbi:MAG: transposase [Chloroflexi bacterium]|nr:MAG: transposase [Chloroflexota bacterium]
MWPARRKKNDQTRTEEGTFWRTTVIETDTRLRIARGIGKSEKEASSEAFRQLKQRGHPDTPPPLVSDGCEGITVALVGVYGQVPRYSGRGRPPKKKRAGEGWQYLQLVKQRNEHGAVIAAEPRVVFGDEEQVLALGCSTAYVERTHLTSRQMNRRLARKSLGFSKKLQAHRAACIFEDGIYNFVRPLKSLREEVNPQAGCFEQRWEKRTPAMAAGLTNHVWNVKELLKTIAVPINNT